ncbi:hypothetical protein C8J55DRAFT_37790 [Lentinula edodes]|uniref:Uncharacterized protein n=1 Tax=Lentinula lateritia TaxID=40482 RepID=A0A9W9DS91_9AGAR|nr:hypothetical protein C8J55DRAFT_37790 [Lentinula edodes]
MNSRRTGVSDDVITLLGISTIWCDLTEDEFRKRDFGPSEDHNRAISTYCLLKGGHVTVIQGPVRAYATRFDDMEARTLESERGDLKELEIVQSLLDTISLDSTYWAHLRYDEKAEKYSLTPGKRPILTDWYDEFPVFLPLVPEEDIELVKFLNHEVAEGVWNGKLVDVFIAYEDEVQAIIVKSTNIFYHSQHLNITFRPLAHITRKSMIVGLIVEKTRGRPLEYRDRTLMYETFNKMQENDLIMYIPPRMEPSPDMFLVCDGVLRINPYHLCFFEHLSFEPGKSIKDFTTNNLYRDPVYNEPEIVYILEELKICECFHIPSTLQSPLTFPVLSHRQSPDLPFPDYVESLYRAWIRQHIKTDKFKRAPWHSQLSFELEPGAEEEIALSKQSKPRKALEFRNVDHRPRKRTRTILVATYTNVTRDTETSGSIVEVEDENDEGHNSRKVEGEGINRKRTRI